MAEINRDLSDSKEQNEMEIVVIKKISEKIAITGEEKIGLFKKATINGIAYEFDFYTTEKKIIGEIYARIGIITSGQIRKVITDCFKLVSATKNLDSEWRKIMVFVDEKVKKQFEGSGWKAKAIIQFGIELMYIELEKEQIERLIIAKSKQKEGMKKDKKS